MEHTSAILSEKEFASRVNVSKRTVIRWRETGEGPAYIRIGRRRIGYALTNIEAWEAKRTFAHRAAELANQPRSAA